MNYKVWGWFLIFLVCLVAGELIFGCAISFSRIPNASGLACKDDNLPSYIVNIIFQLFIILIVFIGIIIAPKKTPKTNKLIFEIKGF